MATSLHPDRLRRYAAIARLLARHGRGDLLASTGIDGALEEPDGHAAAGAEQLTDDLERLGPTYVKLGQLLSTRSDMLPPAYLEALSRLQDDVEPVPFADVERVIAEELGVRPNRAFAELDPDPLGSASLAQVHRGVTRSGRDVAVKVQRPGIRERIALDLDVLGDIADLLDAHTDVGRQYRFSDLHEQFRKSLRRELDFALEARNLAELRTDLREFDRLVVPAPVPDLSGGRVLTMDLVRGRKITDLGGYARMDLEGRALADQLVRSYLEQILVRGFMHADPHPGNVLLTDDGRLALVDLGMTERLAPTMQERLLRLLVGIGEGNVDVVTDATVAICDRVDGFERERYAADVADLLGRISGAGLDTLQVGGLVAEVARLSVTHGLRPPPQLVLLGKTLLNLDVVARTLVPDYDPNEMVRESVADITTKRLWRDASAGSALSLLIDVKEFVEQLPGRMNRILDTLGEGKLQVEVDAVDEHELMRMAQKVANRVTAGLILAALIVGASMLMQVDVEHTILGYPALAIVLFVAAAGAGSGLLLFIWLSDEHRRFRPKR